MTQAVDLDPSRLDVFATRLASSVRRRVDGRGLWNAFAQAFPGRPQGPDERRWLGAALEELATRGAVRLPATRRCWDSGFGVALPRWVEVERAVPAARSRAWLAFPWHPRLQWVAELRQLSPREERFLDSVQRGLVEGRFQLAVPLKYRSLQLLGNEKGLERLGKGRLFRPGRLSLEILGCLPDEPPLAWASVGAAPVALVLENAGAYAVARSVLAGCPSPYGVVVFGDGRRFVRSVTSLATIGRPLERICYVGDLDPPGMRIAEQAAERARRSGLPPVVAAPGVHQAMLEAAAEFGYPQGWPAPGGHLRDARSSAVEFLPAGLRERVLELFGQGRRIPEEVLGPGELRAAIQRNPAPA